LSYSRRNIIREQRRRSSVGRAPG